MRQEITPKQGRTVKCKTANKPSLSNGLCLPLASSMKEVKPKEEFPCAVMININAKQFSDG